jgi:ubiquinone biosynthesis protein UbiJ
MWSILALGAVERCIHHLIDLDAITRIQLNALQGKMLRVVIDTPQLSVDIAFDDGKVRLAPTPTGQHQQPSIFEQRPFDQADLPVAATATLHVDDVVALLKLLLSEDVGNIPVQGDYRLLQQLQQIMQNTELDLASHLSPWIGAKLAHEIGKIQQVAQQLKSQFASHAFIVEDYLKEDSGLFAPRWQMDDLSHATRTLQQNLDRAEAKIQALRQHIQSL